jgi:glycosyltransferase involved in cell wall biosynthesis
MFLSLIIPVFNRPQEIDELLSSLVLQTNSSFEVIVVEDGSDLQCKDVIDSYSGKLNISYYFKPNSGPGLSRNFGAEKAKGDYLIFLDSDCIIPENYIQSIYNVLENSKIDAFGGPDAAHSSFTPIQKAINYSMTSFFTTGGIRGSKKGMEKFHPRSFNMGISRDAFHTLKGFSNLRFGEDIDFSIRLFENSYKVILIPEAYVYHKRRTDLKKFFKQVYNSGLARINLHLLHPGSMKIVHFLPALFVCGSIFLLLLSFFNFSFLLPLFIFIGVIFIDAFVKERNLLVALYAVPASFTQLFGYGLGFIDAFVNRLVFNRKNKNAFEKNFYR